jgi:CheY-like chemotaxis protein
VAKVLVAEDSEINQKLIAHLLRRLGVEYFIVDNGEKAVHEALRDRYAIVFMDVVMPVKNGLDASREILAALPAAVRPAIVALTANVEEADQEACINAGMQDFLKKPMQLDDVKRIIDKFLPVA